MEAIAKSHRQPVSDIGQIHVGHGLTFEVHVILHRDLCQQLYKD